MAVLANRVKMSTSTIGTGTIDLDAAETGYQSFADGGITNGQVVSYAIEDGAAWEIGTGTYTTGTPDTLSRTVSESSNSGSPINLTGNAVVFITALSGDLQNAVDMDQGVATTDSPSFAGLSVNSNPVATAGSLSNRNKIINGAMQVAQRGTNFAGGTANADDAYTLDRWYVLSEGSDSVDVDQVADSPDTGGKSIRLDVETTGEKFGIAQIVEAINCTGLIGNTVTLSFAAKVSDARIDTVKAAIVAWSGTADTVTSDIISAWNADGTTPTLIANATFENTPADLGVTTSWATYTITASVDTASAANIILFIWSDDATNPLAGDFLYITNVQLEPGDTATPFEHRSYGQELALCQRYYERDTDNSSGTLFYASNVTSGSAYYVAVSYRVTKRAAATVTVSNTLNSGAFSATVTASSSAVQCFRANCSAVSTGSGAFFRAAWAASAEL
jgi:hypothetical protein